jgi:hypothetical protein
LSIILTVRSALPAQQDREHIDDEAHEVVITAYREACRTSPANAFDAALDSYRRKYPQIKRELASYAVAHILATAGM